MEAFLKQQQRGRNVGSSPEEESSNFLIRSIRGRKKSDDSFGTIGNEGSKLVELRTSPTISTASTLFSSTKKKLWSRSTLGASTFQVFKIFWN